MAERRPWHSLTVAQVLDELGTSTQGLTSNEAEARLAKFGLNEIQEAKRVSAISLVLSQFKQFLIIILIVAATASLVLGEVLDAVVILLIVIASAVLGFVQEFRAERALEALKRMAAPEATLIRDATEVKADATQLVPGDIALLETGDRVPADGRVIESVNLQADESALTGESGAVPKTVTPGDLEAAVADRGCMVYAGTVVTYGRGKIATTETGMRTEFGKIATLLQSVKKQRTPLEMRLAHLGRWLGAMSIAIAAIVTILGILRGQPILAMLIWGVSIAVAAVPEALPAVVTGALAIGVQKMARRNAIVRKLPAVETLGSATVICSDKTGTLTKSEMTVREVFANGGSFQVSGIGYSFDGAVKSEVTPGDRIVLSRLAEAAVLCNDASVRVSGGKASIRGDPTEAALIVLAFKLGVDEDETRDRCPRVFEIPFTSERKLMTTVHKLPDGSHESYMKGAPEVVLAHCDRIEIGGTTQELTPELRHKILSHNEEISSHALRVLALGYKSEVAENTVAYDHAAAEEKFVFLGLTGMIDPPREEAVAAVREAEEAGVRVVMITGDHKLTATAIARELGILKSDSITITGSELDRLTDSEFEKIVERVGVYARVSPVHKLRIVSALKKRGHVVAMTGDGVNDAPALKEADIGIAMGITGTDVTKEASDMILTDDNFATIVAAMEEGRGIYDNIKKYLAYLLSSNVGEVLIVLIASLIGLPLPLLAIQILWINLVTDGLPALALGVDPADPDVMKRSPRRQSEGVFTVGVLALIGIASVLMAAYSVPMFEFLWSRDGLDKSRTGIFTMVVLFEMFNAFNCRSERHSILKVGPFRNRWLIVAVAVSTLMQIMVVQVPFIQPAFQTVGLDLQEWLLVTLSAATVVMGAEGGKYVVRRFSR